MEVVAVRGKVAARSELELWIEEGYNRLQQRFQDELTREEQAAFLWNTHVELTKILSRRAQV